MARRAGENERRDGTTAKPQFHAFTKITPPSRFVPAGSACGLRFQNTKLKRASPMNSP
jgi:hypothetical protein